MAQHCYMEAWLRKLSTVVHITAQNSICNAKDISHQLYFCFIVFGTELIAFYSFYQLHSSKNLNTLGLNGKRYHAHICTVTDRVMCLEQEDGLVHFAEFSLQ